MTHPTTIGFLTLRIDGAAHSAILAGLHDVVRQANARLIVLCGFPTDGSAPALARDQVDGWLAMPDGADHTRLREVAATGKPLVTIDVVYPDLCPGVVCDNHAGMHGAIQHLIGHGHRRIAFVNFSAHPPIQTCFEGYQQALADASIPFDPTLVHDVSSFDDDLGPAVQGWLALESPCTAVATGLDWFSIRVLDAVQGAGYRVPGDVAVVGFDDYELTQYATPALTSVRKPFEDLGRTAARLLLDQIAGQVVPPGPSYRPGVLVPRRSCGCGLATLLSPPPDSASSLAADWQAPLAEQLVALAHYPLPLDPAVSPAQAWPGSVTLIQGLAAALAGTAGPTAEELERAWRQTLTPRTDLAACNALLTMLERAADRQLAAAGRDTAAAARLELFLAQVRLQLHYASHAGTQDRMDFLETMVRNTHSISMDVLEGGANASRQLTWLRTTPMNWGCLGLWDAQADGSPMRVLVVSATYSRADDTAIPLGQRYATAEFPNAAQLPTATAGGPDFVVLLPIATTSRDWGVLALAGPVISELTGLRLTYPSTTIWATLLGAALERAALVESLAERQATLQAAFERERALAETVRQLGCPIIPLLPEVLLVPLVGAIDTQRAQQVIEAVLQGVSVHQATAVLLDITGVLLVDTQVANSLIQTARAAQLLGAQVILVGVRPEIAQSIVELGLDLRNLTTYSSLAAAIDALQRLAGGGAVQRDGEADVTPARHPRNRI